MTEQSTLIRNGNHSPGSVPPARLGEELPIFCERCGYSLYGLPQNLCDHCAILHFKCPECGHTQPINTLRPAIQRILGRMRGWVLSGVVFGKIVFVSFFLFMWFIMGAEWSYVYDVGRAINPMMTATPYGGPYPARLSPEMLLGFTCFGLPFGMVCRMLLLRWKTGGYVGLVLGGLVVVAVLLGARFTHWERSIADSPFTSDFFVATGVGFGAVVIGAVVAWPIWCAAANIFLPTRTARALLEWQKNLSQAAAPTLGRE